MGGFHEDSVYILRAAVALIAGDPLAAKKACEMAVAVAAPQRVWFAKALAPMAEALLGCGELIAARRWTDEVVELAPGGHRVGALTARAIVALAQGEPNQAERDAHAALALALQTRAFLRIATTFDCLGLVAADGGDRRASARLLGVAAGIRQRTGEIRFVLQPECDAMAAELQQVLGRRDFDAAWAEGAALSTEEAIAYTQRGRGERKRPASGWDSLTPTERDVVRLAAEGLGNKDIAERLFVSPRTVQTHLTHVYAKLGLASRIQLVQEAARHV